MDLVLKCCVDVILLNAPMRIAAFLCCAVSLLKCCVDVILRKAFLGIVGGSICLVEGKGVHDEFTQ